MKQYVTVPEFLADLDPVRREQVELLRSIIQHAHAGFTEHIKWNAPSYVLDGRDRLTFNLLNREGAVKLVLHMGATRKEIRGGQPILTNDKGLVYWPADIRGIMTFTDLADIQTHKSDIAEICSRWVAIA